MRAVASLVAVRDREDVAAVFQVSLKAVDKWWSKWLAGGRGALVAQPRGRRVGEHQLLSEVEQQAVRQAVLDHRPCDVGLAGQLWTRAGVGNLIAKLYRERLTGQGVGKYLRRRGLTFQHPDKRGVEQNAEAVRVWHQETWPAIRAKARAEGSEVLFADQVGIRSDQVTGRTATGRFDAAHDRPQPLRPALADVQPGQLRDEVAVLEASILVQGGLPGRLGQPRDDRLVVIGDLPADGVADRASRGVQGFHVFQQPVGGSGPVHPDEDLRC